MNFCVDPTSIIPTKFEAPTPIRSWVMSDNVSRWLPLKVRTRPLRMRRITWVQGQKQLHFWNQRPQFAYSLYNFYWATTTIKGRFLSSITNAKALDSVNFLCVTLWPWPVTFWPWTVVVHGESRDQTLPPSMKTLRLSVLELRVITFPIGYHWKCVRGHCSCAKSHDPWVGGQKQLHIWNPRPRLACSLCNFYWATTTIKGRLLSSCPMLKPFSGKKSKSLRNGAQKWRFWGKMGVETLDFGFATPKRHFLARKRVVWRILRQNRCTRLGCSLSQGPKKNSRVTLGGAKSRIRRTETPKPIWTKFCLMVDIPDAVTYTNCGDHRLRGFWVAGGQISPSPTNFHQLPIIAQLDHTPAFYYCKKLNSLKHLVRTTVAESHN